FHDSSRPGTDPTIYTATIDWGDGTSSTGTVTYDPNLNQFLISGAHDFTAAAGSKAVISVSLIDNVIGDVALLGSEVTLDEATAPAAQVQFDSAAIEAYRNGSKAAITVDRVGDASLPPMVDVHVSGSTAVDGTDYQSQALTLTFAAGATSATFTVPIYA